jgi:Mu-like prophage protein
MKSFLFAAIVALGLTPVAHADLNDNIHQGEEVERPGWGNGGGRGPGRGPDHGGPGRGPGRPGPGRPDHGGPGWGGPRPGPRPQPPRPAPPRPQPPRPHPGPGYPPPAYNTEFVRCESYGYYGVQECYINPYRVRQIRLYNQYSYDPCIQGRTYGWRQDRVWVSNGCRATFEIVRY